MTTLDDLEHAIATVKVALRNPNASRDLQDHHLDLLHDYRRAHFIIQHPDAHTPEQTTWATTTAYTAKSAYPTPQEQP